MWTWMWTCTGVAIALSGCRTAAPSSPSPQAIAPPTGAIACVQPACPAGSAGCAYQEMICPDPTTDCCQPNGIGIYTDDGGYAGIGDHHVMITHFMTIPNRGVVFEGRALNAQQAWTPVLGQVVSADVQGQSSSVVSVSEAATVPTWTLAGGRAVTGDQLAELTLHILVDDHRYALGFTAAAPTGTHTQDVHAYRLRWTAETPTAWQDYCFDGGTPAAPQIHNPDPVVFQQGINVDPLSGKVARDHAQSLVTVSCLRGAPATVYGWGYAYNAAPKATFFFDAGIHMKRAAYCGDSRHFTEPNTWLDIADSAHIQGGSLPMAKLEAWWSPDGATCLNLKNARRPELLHGFNGVCNGKQPLPRCAEDPSAIYLGDQASPSM